MVNKRYHNKHYGKYKKSQYIITGKSRTKEYRKDYGYRYYYGVSLKQVKELYNQQGGLCRICQIKMEFNTRKMNRVCLDHDHDIEKIRGLLCASCNAFLSNLEKLGNIRGLQKRIERYLNNH